MIGAATVTRTAQRNEHPVRFAGREFPYECALLISGLAAPLTGLELAPLVTRLDAFPDPASWSARMRRALVPLSGQDAALVDRLLGPLLEPPGHHMPGYAALVPTA